MYKMFSAILASTFLTFAPLSAVADEAEMKAQVAEISAGLVARLPMDQKIVLKALSPEESGLPEDFLRKLTSDLEAALLVASNFEINLANRLSTEELWSEATEFGDADFEELYAASQANIMLMLIPRATGAGLEISVTAYQLLGDEVGQVIASSGSVILAMDMESSLGVDVNSLNDQMAQVLQEIEKVGQTGGLISSPNTYAEYYHNARILQQRGEVDLAMANYELALKENYVFVDPLIDLLDLATTRYGEAASRTYVEKKIIPLLNDELIQLVEISVLQLDDWSTIDLINEGHFTFPPAMAMWLRSSAKRMKQVRDGNIGFEAKTRVDAALLTAVRTVIGSFDDNSFPNYFIDNIRSLQYADKFEAAALEQELNRAYVHRIDYVHELYSPPIAEVVPILCRWEENQGILTLTLDGTPSGNEYLNNLNETEKAELILQKSSVCNASFESEYRLEVEGRPVRTLTIDDFIYDNEGFSGSPCGLMGAADWQAYMDGVMSVSIQSPSREDTYAVDPESIIGGMVFSAPEIMPIGGYLGGSDYAVYADACVNRIVNSAHKPAPEGYYVIPYLGGLIMTDKVDVSKPIYVQYREVFGDAGRGASDITKDGTYISRLGPTIGGGNGEYGYFYRRTADDWFFAPGLLQSSILERDIAVISYTNMSGDAVELTNIEYVDSSTFMPEQVDYSDEDMGQALYRLGLEELNNAPKNWWDMENFIAQQADFYAIGKSRKPLVCGVNETSARIANVQTYTNLRQRAGLNERVIAEVPLGASVAVSDPGSYFRTDRCAAACNGIDQNAIDVCIENNEVWIGVVYNGRQGFLSRKFVE